jgi:hypothetical protein
MVNMELIAGITGALERGQSLKSAMVSFFNAGYSKEEIEEAARVLIEVGTNPDSGFAPVTSSISFQSKGAKQQEAHENVSVTLPKNSANAQTAMVNTATGNFSGFSQRAPVAEKKLPEEKMKLKPVQKISDYDHVKSKRRPSVLIIVLAALLIILLGVLVAMFLFRRQLVDWLASLF